MLPPTDGDLLRHRELFSSYYESAGLIENRAMGALYFVRQSLQLPLDEPILTHSTQVKAVLSKIAEVLEFQFLELVRIVYSHPAYYELSEAQRQKLDTGCLSIKFNATLCG